MTYQLFLDDERYPVLKMGTWNIATPWHIARNYDDAVWYVQNLGLPRFISFDHDLGAPQNQTGYDFAKWLCNHIEDNGLNVDDFDFSIHSQNPIGAENIRTYMTNFLRYYCG